MAENKFLNKKTALVSLGAVAAYLIYKQMSSAKESEGLPQGSLGGEDDLTGQQGFDIDPNSPIPDSYSPNETFFYVQPDGTINATPTPSTPDGSSPITDGNTPTYSSGSGSLVADTAMLGGALGFNALLPSLGKGIKNAVDSKYLFKAEGDVAAESNFQKWLKDPFNIGDSATSKILKEGEQGAFSVAQSGEKPLIREAGEQAIQTVPKWAKGIKGVANFIPLLDIPIGAGLDVYFSKYEEDPSKKIDWWSAIKANTAGELAQLGITGGAAAASSVVPVAGTIAGGVGGFIVGTGADIAATEASYKAMGKSSLFDFGSSSTPAQISKMTPAQQTAQANLFSSLGISSVNPFQSQSVATYDASTNTYTSASGAKMSMAASAPQAQAAKQVSSSSSSSSSSSALPAIFQPAANPFSSSGGSSSSSSSSKSSSSSQNMSVAPKTSTSSSASSSAAVSASKAPSTTSSVASKVSSVASTVSSAAKTTVSAVTNAAKSAASAVKSFFSGGKRK